jgi:hypothetical protein
MKIPIVSSALVVVVVTFLQGSSLALLAQHDDMRFDEEHHQADLVDNRANRKNPIAGVAYHTSRRRLRPRDTQAEHNKNRANQKNPYTSAYHSSRQPKSSSMHIAAELNPTIAAARPATR